MLSPPPPPLELTVRARIFESFPAEFAAVTVMLNVPAVVGIPEIVPALEHDSPLGSPDALHVIGVVPVAPRVTEYESPTLPFARLVVVIVGATAFSVMTLRLGSWKKDLRFGQSETSRGIRQETMTSAHMISIIRS